MAAAPHRFSAERLRGAAVLVEGLTADGAALARLFAGRGADVTLADRRAPGRAPYGDVAGLEAGGIAVTAPCDLDATLPPCALFVPDVWTAETAGRIVAAQAAGAEVWSIGEVALELAGALPAIGITGTAGKTTTTRLVEAMLGAAGIPIVVAHEGRAENAWPNAEVLRALDAGADAAWLLVELTSSHLAFMSRSARIGVITNFWPDHLELHGTLDRYRAAKETLLAAQTADDIAVLNADDGGSVDFDDVTPARVVHFAVANAVERGACVRRGEIVLRDDDGERRVVDLARVRVRGSHLQDALAATATAAAADVPVEAIADVLARMEAPRWRLQRLPDVDGRAVYSDAMAATPRKALAALDALAGERIVLVAGGIAYLDTGEVHASRVERRLLREACEKAIGQALGIVAFGEAAPRLSAALVASGTHGKHVEFVRTLDEAFATARTVAADADATCIVLAPMFPLGIEERERFDALVAAAAAS
jgi:UDP-N-acetylmuramoylalanine--D-glutamate ligase